MSCKPDLETTYRMYDEYCQGKSLAAVGKLFDVSRQTVYTRFVRQGLDMRPRKPALPHVDYGGRRFTLGFNGYYRATEGDRAYNVDPLPDLSPADVLRAEWKTATPERRAEIEAQVAALGSAG